MDFGTKLKMLLDVFQVSNKRLANSIHVDPSTISRWINHQRNPSDQIELIDNIINFFLKIDVFEYKKTEFLKLMADNSDIPNLDTLKNKELFKVWFCQEEKSFSYKEDLYLSSNKHKTKNSDVSQFLSDINIISDHNHWTHLTEKINHDYNTNHFGTKEVKVYFGAKGLRSAILSNGFELLEDDSPGELLLSFQGEFNWYTNDTFYIQWMDLMKQLLMKNHKIIIIYNLKNGFPEIMPIISSWLQLIFMKNFELYYYPVYGDNFFGTTVSLIPNKSLVFSYTGNDENFGYTFFLKDRKISASYKVRLTKLINNIKPLIYTYPEKKINDLLQKAYTMEKYGGFFYRWKNNLPSLSIHPNIYNTLLSKVNLSHEEKQLRLNIQKRQLENLNKRITFYREICLIDVLDKMTSFESFEYLSTDLFCDGHIKASKEMLIKHLKSTIKLLERYENYEIALISEKDVAFKNILNITLKESNGLIVSAKNSNNQITYILINESTVVNAFENYLNDFWYKLPHITRDKTWVISKIKSKINLLNQMQSL